MEFASLLMLNAGHGIEPMDFAFPATKVMTSLMVHAFTLAQTQLQSLTLDVTFGKKASASNARLDGCSMRPGSVSLSKTSVELSITLLNVSPAIEDTI